MKLVLALVFAAVLAQLACAQNSPWAGTWTNHAFGGLLYTCVTGNTLSGTFSNIGIVEGTVSSDGRSVNGTWAYIGYTDYSSGVFTWLLGSSNNTFSGNYYPDLFPCSSAPWSPTNSDELISTDVSVNQCIPLAPSGTGTVQTATYVLSTSTGSSTSVTVCTDTTNNKYYGFYTVGGTNGYIAGNILWSGRLLQGSFSSSSVVGIESYLLTDANTLVNIYINGYTYVQQVPVSVILNPPAIDTYILGNTNLDSTQCLSQRNQFPTWSGTFSDTNFGYGRSFFCQSGSQVWGVYSEVGFFQATVDPLNSNNITGTFYDAGDTTVGGKGTFQLLMADDSNTFSGNWQFDGENQTYPWADARISPNTPTVDQCMTPTTSATNMAGRWVYSLSQFNNLTMDLCFNDQGTRYSYSYASTDNSLLGYGLGWTALNGTALRGQWFSDSFEGIEYWVSIFNGDTAINSVWPFVDLQTVQYFPCQGNIQNNWFLRHDVVNFTRVDSVVVDRAQCNRNSYLNIPHPIPSAVPSGVSPTPRPSKSPLPEHTSWRYNSSSSMTVASAVMAFFVVLLFFI